jgi:hypothetical protein
MAIETSAIQQSRRPRRHNPENNNPIDNGRENLHSIIQYVFSHRSFYFFYFQNAQKAFALVRERRFRALVLQNGRTVVGEIDIRALLCGREISF